MTRGTLINDQICSTDSVAKAGAENGYWRALLLRHGAN